MRVQTALISIPWVHGHTSEMLIFSCLTQCLVRPGVVGVVLSRWSGGPPPLLPTQAPVGDAIAGVQGVPRCLQVPTGAQCFHAGKTSQAPFENCCFPNLPLFRQHKSACNRPTRITVVMEHNATVNGDSVDTVVMEYPITHGTDFPGMRAAHDFANISELILLVGDDVS